MEKPTSKPKQRGLALGLAAGWTFFLGWSSSAMAAAAPEVSISQVPMTITLPAHPQILLAIGNSQSMDGDLSGAIHTGSGAIAQPLLSTSSSPMNFTIPAGFTPPVNRGAGATAPYTVNTGGTLIDNSASRLNVAKAGITSILNAFIASADFALMDYQTGSPTLSTTWVYQMSNPGGFTFTNSATAPSGSELVPNPCFGISAEAGAVQQDCQGLRSYYAGVDLKNLKYMVVAASSDDASVNDVLYSGGLDPVCITYGAVSPATQFTPPNNLGAYNDGAVYEQYPFWTQGCASAFKTGPTNAGFVPASAEVMYEQRGFGFYTSSETASGGNMVVNMTSSGATPTATSVANAIAAFTPYLAPETNSGGTREIKATATQSPIAGLVAQAKAYFASNPATTNGCATQRYLVLMTDGLPTMDMNGSSWPPLGSTSALGYGVSTSNDQAYIDAVNQLQLLAAAGIKTYIIGLGQATDSVKYPTAAATLNAMATAGGTDSYFAAVSPGDVANDLQVIVTTILDQSQSTSSAAVNSTGLNANSIVYQPQFVTSDTFQDWTGNLFAFPIDPTTGVVNTSAPLWSAQAKLDVAPSRFIATWDPLQGAGVPFEWTQGAAVNGIGRTTVLGQELQTFAPDPNGQDVLQYLRGSSAQEVRNGGKFRDRSHLLGDIVGSNPAYIGASNEGIQAPSYVNFAASTAARPPIVYIGANDGMLHAFDAAQGYERFAYIPRGVYANLVNLAYPYYNAQHRFYVNGATQAGDVQFADLTWHTVLVGAEGAGGNSVYALDITNPGAISSEIALANSVLWDFKDSDLGLGFSTPVIASTSHGWAALVGNGYNSTNQKPFLYAIDPEHGSLVAKVDLCAAAPAACNLSAPNGLSSLIAVNSSGQVAGFANLVYAGDLQGNLWRIDLSNANPALWAASVMFQARDALGNPQPITTKPVASLNPRYPQILGTMVMFATGQFLGVPDLTNQNVQSIYGVYDPPAGYTTPLARANLLQQTLATATVGTVQVRTVSGTHAVVPANKGWYMDLSLLAGERVINDPRLASGGELVLTTYQPIPPAAGSCGASGTSYLMVINYATGGNFTTPQFDVTGDRKINASDTVVPFGGLTAVAPVGVALGAVYASAPIIRSGAFTTGSAIALITESTPGLGASGTATGGAPVIQPVMLKGSSKTRTAWWEIRQ